MQQQNNEYIGINFFLRFLFNFVTAIVSFVRVSKISFLSNIERQLNGVYLHIIYDNTYIYNICPFRTQYYSFASYLFLNNAQTGIHIRVYIRQRVWPSPIRAGQHACRLLRNSMRSPSHPPCACAWVRGGWRNTEVAAAGEPFSPLSTKNDWTTPTMVGGRVAVMEVRSIGQMMNDESENIRLTDHRVSLGHTVWRGFKLVHRRPPKI